MFQITQDPSSGNYNLYLTEITYNGSVVLIMRVVGVWRHMLPNTDHFSWSKGGRCVWLTTYHSCSAERRDDPRP